MSDSDDTDILLLIPPDYFIATAQEKLQQEERARQQQRQLQKELEATAGKYCGYNMPTMDTMATVDPPAVPPTAAYRFLPPNKKAELNLINARLQSIESEHDGDVDDEGDNAERFAAPSDISTISACTVRSQMKSNVSRLRNGLVHSTPKGRQKFEQNVGEQGVLLEIDNFLEERQLNSLDWNGHNEDYRLNNANPYCEPLASSLPGTMNRLSIAQAPPTVFEAATTNAQTMQSSRDHNLISLSELWSKSGQNTAIAAGANANTANSMSLQEEHLRRQHLERTVHALQTRLLEYQQRISVAIEVDKQKDALLRNHQAACKSLEEEVAKLRETIERLEHEQRECNTQRDSLQKELAQAVSLATKFQEKNEKLEIEINDTARKTSEFNSAYKTQLEDLEIKLHGCKRSEEFALNELGKFKDKLAKAEYQSEKLKVRCEELEKENTTLKHQKEMLQDFHQKLKVRSDGLETQRKSLQDSIAHLTENEMALKKKLEAQQKSLKMHYQQQLENVVAQKLREFQEQLDKTEERLKSEGRERERLIADRAVKQLELINEKNELEHNLLQEKHIEEVELYRIQLANASKKIDDLESKLKSYKSKRADMAEKLHDVMETQWQRALEILISPNGQCRSLDSNIGSDFETSPENNNLPIRKEHAINSQEPSRRDSHQSFFTPKSSKLRKSISKPNNLNVASETNAAVDNNKLVDTVEPEPIDRLQAYIELLLSKSPSDVDKLNEILSLTKKTKSTNGKSDKTIKRHVNNHTKPPWKA